MKTHAEYPDLNYRSTVLSCVLCYTLDMLLLLEDSTVRFVSCAKSGGVKDMLLLPKYSSVKFVSSAISGGIAQLE